MKDTKTLFVPVWFTGLRRGGVATATQAGIKPCTTGLFIETQVQRFSQSMLRKANFFCHSERREESLFEWTSSLRFFVAYRLLRMTGHKNRSI
jgi:hypothetical protein